MRMVTCVCVGCVVCTGSYARMRTCIGRLCAHVRWGGSVVVRALRYEPRVQSWIPAHSHQQPGDDYLNWCRALP